MIYTPEAMTIPEIQAALDALPLNTTVELNEDDAAVKRDNVFGVHAWYITGVTGPNSSDDLARYCTPIRVLVAK